MKNFHFQKSFLFQNIFHSAFFIFRLVFYFLRTLLGKIFNFNSVFILMTLIPVFYSKHVSFSNILSSRCFPFLEKLFFSETFSFCCQKRFLFENAVPFQKFFFFFFTQKNAFSLQKSLIKQQKTLIL